MRASSQKQPLLPIRRPGERLTRQRQAVLRLFTSTAGHLTAEDVLAALKHDFPNLNTGTVYRELSWLKDRGLISETDVGKGCKVYERVTDPPHHHLICLCCGTITDLDDRYFASLRLSLQQETGFLPRIEHFAVFGTCPACQKIKKEVP